jgi:hypothetical protein
MPASLFLVSREKGQPVIREGGPSSVASCNLQRPLGKERRTPCHACG